jgi:hypothetical protein
MSNSIEIYTIKSNQEVSVVRDKIDSLFKETNNVFKGKFVGSIKNDTFQGSTNYSTNITINGKVTQDDEKTLVEIKISDDSPDYSKVVNVLLITFLAISFLIVASSKNSTNIIHYIIPIVIFGFTFLAFKIYKIFSKFWTPKLIKSAEIIAKEIDGKIESAIQH